MATLETPDSSPTTSIYRLLITGFISLLLAVVLGARGVVHAGNAMSDGPMRTVTLDIGHTVLSWTEPVHLDYPWNQLTTALGNKPQPDVPPLLAAIPTPLPTITPPSASLRPPKPARPGTIRVVATKPRTQRRHRSTKKPVVKPAVAGHPLRRPTRKAPLRLLVTGDSLSGYLGPELIDEVAKVGPEIGFTDTHNGTGITRPDFVDWSLVAQQQVAADDPDAVVVMMGGNDFQNMTLPNGKFFTAGTRAWTIEYQRRVEVCMRIWARSGTRRVYWLSIAPARETTWGYIDTQINLAIRRAAADVPGAEYLDVLGRVTDHGRYADFVKVGGVPTLVREPDGVHLNLEGSTLVAQEVMPVIRREWFRR